jgi:hypothetical protein
MESIAPAIRLTDAWSGETELLSPQGVVNSSRTAQKSLAVLLLDPILGQLAGSAFGSDDDTLAMSAARVAAEFHVEVSRREMLTWDVLDQRQMSTTRHPPQ